MPQDERPAFSHPPLERLRAFARGELDRVDGKAVARHLLRCATCREATVPLARALFHPPPVDPAQYDFPVGRFCAAVRREVHRSRRERAAQAPPLPSAEALLEALLPPVAPLGERHWRQCERLLEESWKARHADPEQMLQLAAFASALAERIDPTLRGSRALADLQARALAAVGNARRVTNDLHGAEAALAEALERSADGSGEALLLAFILNWLAGVYVAQRRFGDARRLFESALRLYEQHGARHDAGDVMLQLGLAELYDAAPEAAANRFLAALPLLDPRADPKALPFCWHNLAASWADCGQFELAAEVVWRARELFSELADPLIQARLVWLDGRIAAGLGHPGRAERCFQQAREAFLARKLPYPAAIVALELAILWFESGRTAEARTLVFETLRTFSLIKVRREAYSAVLLLSRAATQDCLNITMLRTAVADLKKADR